MPFVRRDAPTLARPDFSIPVNTIALNDSNPLSPTQKKTKQKFHNSTEEESFIGAAPIQLNRQALAKT